MPPDVAGAVSGFARALVGAARARQLYSVEHPAAAQALGRLRAAVEVLAASHDVQIGVSPDTLFVNGEPLGSNRLIAEAAGYLHEHDILGLRVISVPSFPQLSEFLQLLSSDVEELRRRGGPAACWGASGYVCIEVDQLDYGALLSASSESAAGGGRMAPGSSSQSREVKKPAAPVRDAVWQALVRSLSAGATALQESIRYRLREIAQSVDGIEALTNDLVGAQRPDGGPNQRAAQAAAVLFAYDRLVRQIESMAPEFLPDTLRNIATAASRLDPDLLMQTVCDSAESGVGADVTRAIGGWFDDGAIAQLLARSMGAEGRATARMAAALSTLAPDPDRQRRVLRLARTIETAPGGLEASDVGTAWQSLQQMLDAGNDSLFTSAEYAHALHEAELRSHRLRLQAPEHLAAWLASVSSDSMRSLSVTLLLDLFTVEDSPTAISDAVLDLAAAAEELLSAGDIAEADRIFKALDPAGLAGDPVRAPAARRALGLLARSAAVADLARAAGDLAASEVEWLRRCCTLLGPGVLDTVVPVFAALPAGPGRDRVGSVISRFGPRAIEALKPLVASPEWPLCRAAMQVIARTGGPAAVEVLQPFTRGTDALRAREAVALLAELDEESADRALANLLMTGTAAERAMTVDALVACQDSRSSELIATAVGALNPFGRDINLALQMLGALQRLGDNRAVEVLAGLAEAADWRHPRRTLRVKRAAIEALATLRGAEAERALETTAARGDWLTRRLARKARRQGD